MENESPENITMNITETPVVDDAQPPVSSSPPPPPPTETDIPYVVMQEPIVLETGSLPPRVIFIVPYRDREQQKTFFLMHMKSVLEDYAPGSYEIYFIHQQDTRDFNRGAMKNIGFLYVKEKYPNDYTNITLVFNDIDTMPYSKNFLDYPTVPGKIKHFYGFTFALGGIVSITGGDFEKLNGFPNFWAWGYEDNELNRRAKNAQIEIDRSQFFPIMDKNIFQMKDGLMRSVNRNEFERYASNTTEGILSIQQLKYQYDASTGHVNVTHFITDTNPTPEANRDFNITHGLRPFEMPASAVPKIRSGRRKAMQMFL